MPDPPRGDGVPEGGGGGQVAVVGSAPGYGCAGIGTVPGRYPGGNGPAAGCAVPGGPAAGCAVPGGANGPGAAACRPSVAGAPVVHGCPEAGVPVVNGCP